MIREKGEEVKERKGSEGRCREGKGKRLRK
jgi:hypothetical protein